MAISAQASKKSCYAEKSLIQSDLIWFQTYATKKCFNLKLEASSFDNLNLGSRYAVVICITKSSQKPAVASVYFVFTLVVNVGLLDG